MSVSQAPAPGQAPLVAPNAAALLRRNAAELGDRPAIRFGGATWTHREYYEESCRFAALFDAALPAACVELANRGVRVIVAGLDQDYLGRPFEPMPHLLAIAEYITKTRAICVVCGNPANHTQRLVASADRVLLGAHGTYEARCRRCFDPLLSRQEPAAPPPAD